MHLTLDTLRKIPFFRVRPEKDRPSPATSGLGHRNTVAALEDAGFWILREGVHVIMTNGQRILTIPSEDPVHALTLEGIVRDAGLSMEQFRQLI
jgi:predicted RNA binding protein YcfA (HicA-like mRNA interferase family)